MVWRIIFPLLVATVTFGQLRVPEAVQERKLIYRVEPKLPGMFCATGVVRFNAKIGKNGTIQSLSLISGHPFLVTASIKAVRQWRYRPTRAGGKPVEVITVISVRFSLEKPRPKRSSRAA